MAGLFTSGSIGVWRTRMSWLWMGGDSLQVRRMRACEWRVAGGGRWEA
jgi:hypothetical protein